MTKERNAKALPLDDSDEFDFETLSKIQTSDDDLYYDFGSPVTGVVYFDPATSPAEEALESLRKFEDGDDE
jgi:hypothetical protein